MGILNRISILFQSKALHIVDEAEDPRETLEYAYERQRELLAGVRQALVEVGTSKHQLSAQAQRLKATMTQLEEQARRGVAAGREDLARLALERRQLAEHQLHDIEQQLAEVTQEEQKLMQAERKFTAAVETFRARRDWMSARYSASQAQAHAGQALAGVSGEMADLGMAIERAESKIERMRARASAVDELLNSGALEDLAIGAGGRVEQELRKQEDQLKVEEQLEGLKKDLAAAGREGANNVESK